MSELVCPKCQCDYCYDDGMNFVCPECAFEWNSQTELDSGTKVLDANGTELSDGDTVTLIKALKLKGSSQSLKQGTKVKNIRLVPDGDHNIDCKIDGSAMMLKSEFVKKS
ncbi:alkylphosphonate utilization protein [Suttonella sp. R2A3]|uniref:zinc ribbon domain-containing protein YjdM n=1 Tax=Suttonella sp. R2A3 TaxID=2908648 RepID=UPI001F3FD71C|nr:zinc ribbon domain-containing protein YjdM [Suttonella sp. R2A3]UJF24020.1 alkylphosphonate utilization protein [Suttonella sp. R2A3]